MAIVSTGALIDSLRQHSLLPAACLAVVPNLVQGRCGDARALARVLVQRGWLTVYQINQILSGKGSDLVFGPYRVLERLGQGGLSEVFKARHADYDMLVALKVIKPEVLSTPDGRQQFMDEMEAMAQLDHPNIVQFCDADQIGSMCYFAMEYVDGTDLGKHVQLGGALPVRDACDYIRQAALGLQHAHEHNLVHRDIKPVNLYLTHPPARPGKKTRRRPHVKILDWGLATLRYPASAGNVSLENVKRGIVGTADYLSPEQARDASTVDIRGDIYSLGCTFYYLLTGQAPFPDGSLMQKIMQHQQAEPRAVDTFRDDVPAGVSAILKRMLAKQPEHRFQTPAALALALLPHSRGEEHGSVNPALSLLRGSVAAAGRDDTPLPVALRGYPRVSSTRSRAADTDCPQNAKSPN